MSAGGPSAAFRSGKRGIDSRSAAYKALQYRHYFRKGEGSLMNEQQEEPQETETPM